MLNLIFLILLFLLFYILPRKEKFQSSVKRLTKEEMQRIIDQQDEKFVYLNDDSIKSYLTEYKCLDYEDIRI